MKNTNFYGNLMENKKTNNKNNILWYTFLLVFTLVISAIIYVTYILHNGYILSVDDSSMSVGKPTDAQTITDETQQPAPISITFKFEGENL